MVFDRIHVDLPGLKYYKDITSVKCGGFFLTEYKGITQEHFETMVAIGQTLSDNDIGPGICGYPPDENRKKYWITTGLMNPVPELDAYLKDGTEIPKELLERIGKFVEKMHSIGICHGDLCGNILQDSKGNLVVVDLDTAFWIGKANQDRLKAYSTKYYFEGSDNLEQEFIQNDITTPLWMN